MRVTVTNISSKILSTDIGLLNPGDVKYQDLSPAECYGVSYSLKPFSDAGEVTITVADDPHRLDVIEPGILGVVSDGSVTSTKIGAGAVLTAAIGAGQVIASKIAPNCITDSQIQALGITSASIANNTLSDTQITANGITSASLATSVLVQSAAVTLSNANLLALQTTAISLVSAPGANTAIMFLGAIVHYKYSVAAFTIGNADNVLSVGYTNEAGTATVKAVGSLKVTGIFDQGSDTAGIIMPVSNIVTPAAALVIGLQGTGPALTIGSGTAKLIVFYRIVSTNF